PELRRLARAQPAGRDRVRRRAVAEGVLGAVGWSKPPVMGDVVSLVGSSSRRRHFDTFPPRGSPQAPAGATHHGVVSGRLGRCSTSSWGPGRVAQPVDQQSHHAPGPVGVRANGYGAEHLPNTYRTPLRGKL